MAEDKISQHPKKSGQHRLVEFPTKPAPLPGIFDSTRPNRLNISVSDAILKVVNEIGMKDQRGRGEVLALLLEAGIVAYHRHEVQLSQLRNSLTS